MSYNLTSDLHVGVRSLTEILENYCLPIPVEREDSSGTVFVADASTVRHWVRRAKSLWSRAGGCTYSQHDIRFMMMMQVIQSDIDLHVIKDPNWQDKPTPEMGVPDDYQAIFS